MMCWEVLNLFIHLTHVVHEVGRCNYLNFFTGMACSWRWISSTGEAWPTAYRDQGLFLHKRFDLPTISILFKHFPTISNQFTIPTVLLPTWILFLLQIFGGGKWHPPGPRQVMIFVIYRQFIVPEDLSRAGHAKDTRLFPPPCQVSCSIQCFF